MTYNIFSLIFDLYVNSSADVNLLAQVAKKKAKYNDRLTITKTDIEIMSNNFIGVGNSTLSNKNSADCLLELLQLNLLGRNGSGVNGPNVANINNMSGNGGNCVVPTSTNLLTGKPNYFHQSSLPNGGIPSGMMPALKTGRPIINTTNLGTNNMQQQQMSQPSHQQTADIFSTNLNTGNDLSDFKNALRIISAENNMAAQKSFRNGDGEFDCRFRFLCVFFVLVLFSMRQKFIANIYLQLGHFLILVNLAFHAITSSIRCNRRPTIRHR